MRAPNDPPDTEISPTTKLVVASLEVKVNESVASLEESPSLTSSAVMVIVGLVSSCSQLN